MQNDGYGTSTKKPDPRLGKHWKWTRAKDSEITRWRMKMRRFEKLKRQILAMLVDTGWEKSDIVHWLGTPKPGLLNRTPSQYMRPRGIVVLHRYAKKHLPKPTLD